MENVSWSFRGALDSLGSGRKINSAIFSIKFYYKILENEIYLQQLSDSSAHTLDAG